MKLIFPILDVGPRGEKKDPTSLGKLNHEIEKDSHEMEVRPRKTTITQRCRRWDQVLLLLSIVAENRSAAYL